MRGSDNMSQRMKNIIKILVFGGIILVLLAVFSLMMDPQKWFDEKLIQNRDARFIQMTEQPADTIDVLNIGDSLSLSTFSPMELWREQGYTGFNIGADGLRMAESYYALKNACKEQKPKVLLVETLYLFRFKLSYDMEMLLSQPIYYRCPFLKYHSIWKSAVELPGVMTYHRGYTVNEEISWYEGPDNYLDLPLEDKDQRTDISWMNRLWFHKIKKYCDEQGIEIILYSTVSAKNYNWDRIHSLEKLAEEQGVAYIDLNEHIGELGIDWKHDTNDGGDHMNYNGCVKVTSYLGNYLKENTDLTDHRGNQAYQDWDEELMAYDQLIEEMDGLSFQDIYNQRKKRIREEKKKERENKKNNTN